MQLENFEYSFTSESRAFCSECEFLTSRCLCETLRIIPNKIHLIILQHPSESKHPLNTVRILKKCFKELTIISGENFSNDMRLNTILCDQKNECALLYPSTDASIVDKNPSYKGLTHLILIDGTWRKAKKIFMLSSNLQTLPTLMLAPEEQSDYRIRKTPTENSLSTLEAAVLALNGMEPSLDTSAATKSFQKMIDYQIKKMGREVYQRNYLDKKKE